MLKILKFFGTPFLLLGFMYYTFIETPFFQGRMWAFNLMLDLVHKDNTEE